MIARSHLIFSALTSLLALSPCQAEQRTFTSTAGTTIIGELLQVKGDMVTIKKKDGQTITVKASAFSRVDQAWLQTQGLKAGSATATTASKKPDAKLKIIKPLKIAVRNNQNAPVDRFVWKGEHAALLSISDTLDAAEVASVLTIMDAVYEFHQQTTGHETPFEFPDIKRDITIEDEALGSTFMGKIVVSSIYARPDIFRDLLRDLSDDSPACNENTTMWFFLYGLHSWGYEPKIGTNAEGFASAIKSGYAESMALLVAQHLGIQLSNSRKNKDRDRKTVVEEQLDAYLKDTALNFQTTLGVNKSPDMARAAFGSPSGGVSALAASFILRLCRDHGGADFNTRLWHELDKRPDAKTDQDGVDNFILAACAAASLDLSELFTTDWRWPMSPRAIAEAKKRWKKA